MRLGRLLIASAAFSLAATSWNESVAAQANGSPSVRQQSVERVVREILVGAPYKQFDPSTGAKNIAIGRTPGSTCEALRFLTDYSKAAPNDTRAREAITSLGGWIVASQSKAEGRPQFGGVPSTPDLKGSSSVYYFAIDAGFCGDAMLRLYRLTGDQAYLQSATHFADFLLTTMRDKSGRSFRQGSKYPAFCEFVIATASPVWNCRRYVKNLLALPFLQAISAATQVNIYGQAAQAARAVLAPGLAGGWEFAEAWSACSTCTPKWRRVVGSKGEQDYFVYGDTIAYALRGLYEYEGPSEQVRSIYFRFADMRGSGPKNMTYDGRIAFGGYIAPQANEPDELNPYYDVVTLGLLHSLKAAIRPDDYRVSSSVLLNCIMPSTRLSWHMSLDLTLPQDGWTDLSTLASLGEALLQSPPAPATDPCSSASAGAGNAASVQGLAGLGLLLSPWISTS